MYDPPADSKTQVLHSIATTSRQHLSRVFEAADLFGRERELGIVKDGTLYTLRLTRLGKLILTK